MVRLIGVRAVREATAGESINPYKARGRISLARRIDASSNRDNGRAKTYFNTGPDRLDLDGAVITETRIST